MTDIPVGYKQTEMGIIPNDWEVKKVSDFTDVVTGGTPNTSIKEFWGGNIKWMASGEVNKKFIYDVEGRITQYGYENSSTHMIPEGCILIGLAGQGKTRGTAAYNYIPLCTNQSIGAILPNDKFVSLYLYYYVDSKYEDLRNLSSGDGGRGGLNKKLLLDIDVVLPSMLSEQQAIATTLSDMDELISSLDKLIEKKKNIKKGAMQKLLTGKKRLPGFTGERKEKRLCELGNLTGAGVDKKVNIDEIPVRLVNFVDVFHKDFLYNSQLNFWVTATPEKVAQCNVKQGDVFFTPSSEMPYDIALSAVAMEDMENVCYSYHVYRFRFTEDIDLKFRTYMFKTKKFYEQANTICEGSGKRYVIGLTKFKELKVIIPPTKEEQQEIATILSDMDKEIEALEEKKAKYEQIKQGAMQKLLTGKIRLV